MQRGGGNKHRGLKPDLRSLPTWMKRKGHKLQPRSSSSMIGDYRSMISDAAVMFHSLLYSNIDMILGYCSGKKGFVYYAAYYNLEKKERDEIRFLKQNKPRTRKEYTDMSDLWEILRTEQGEMFKDNGHDWIQWTSDGSSEARNYQQMTLEEEDINTTYDAPALEQLERTKTTPTDTKILSPLESSATHGYDANSTHYKDSGKPTKRTPSSEVSARFRQRRKEKQMRLVMEVKEAEDEVNKLQLEARILSHENKVLRDLLCLRKET